MAMHTTSFDDLIRNAFSIAIKQAQERIIEEAIQKLRQKLRNDFGNLGVILTKIYSMERQGQNLIITIHDRFKEENDAK